jgi:peptidoglycan/xylan/chitin deacetylase (PgdA/CDA1 family)
MVQQPLTQAELARYHPNETGRIPILMYHSIGDPAHDGHPRYDRHGWNIPPSVFRKQLEMMYAANWYPINMRDALNPQMNIPLGKTPVVLTFDDSRGSQFRYLKDTRIDPDCAVGILEAFHQKHPDWPLRASFYVLPKSMWNPEPFHQHQYVDKKLQFLSKEGFEIANHTYSHHPMAHMSGMNIQRELAWNVRYVQAHAPGVEEDTFALPYGSVPKNKTLMPLLLKGNFQGIAYCNKCVLLAGGDPAFPPTVKRFNPYRIMRIGAEPGHIESWIHKLTRQTPLARYVSDGDPNTVTVPRKYISMIDIRHLDGARLVLYGSTTITSTNKKKVRDYISSPNHRKS